MTDLYSKYIRKGFSKFDKEKSVKEYKRLLEKLYKSTNENMDIKPVEFQELMGKIEVLGELILENK